MSTILFIVIIIIIAAAVIYHNIPKQPHRSISELRQSGAKLVFNGETDGQIYACPYYKIKAKPDFIYEYPNGTLAIVEYKSGKRGVMSSDLVQLIATAIAVKGHYVLSKVTKGYVLTGDGSYQEIDLDRDSYELVKQIENPLKAARDVIRGKMPVPKPSAIKCRGCGFRHVCRFSHS